MGYRYGSFRTAKFCGCLHNMRADMLLVWHECTAIKPCARTIFLQRCRHQSIRDSVDVASFTSAEPAHLTLSMWEGLHASPRTVPSKGAKLCTYHHWFGRPSKVHCEPYYELPMGITRLRALIQFRIGSHALPVERGRFARPSLPRHLRRCNLCSTQAVGDELYYVFDCPHFSDIRGQYPALFQDAEGCMRLFVWHRDQKAVSRCLTAILKRAQNVNTDSSS